MREEQKVGDKMMGWKSNFYKIKSVNQRFLSIYVVFILVLSTTTMMFSDIAQAAPGDDIITAHSYEGSFVPTVEFDDNSSVIINVTVDNSINDPESPPYYSVKATNTNSGEWVNVYVSDNDTDGPFSEVNTPGDGMYWGEFSINSSVATSNAIGPGDPTILQVSNGDEINISEIPPGQGGTFDGDEDIGYEIITAVFSGGSPNNPPDTPHSEEPPNNSENRQLNTDVSWQGDDPDGDSVTYDVYFGTTNPPPKQTSNQSATTYDPGNLASENTYYWKIISWDEYGANTEGPIWSFTTEASGGEPTQFQDTITSYQENGGLSENTDFNVGDTVFVNLTVNDTVGDPDSQWLYNIKASNINTSEWIYVNVTDNQTLSYVSNTADDGRYWGNFTILSDTTQNKTGPDTIANLAVNVNDVIDITEIPGGTLDGDQDIAYQEIIIRPEGGSEPDFQDTMTTYRDEQGLSASNTFNPNSTVVVNLTVNDTTGDPDTGWYYNIKVINTNTSEWILVNVTDNDTHPGATNIQNDGIYWGNFTINTSEATDNMTRVLQVSNDNVVNVTEIPGGTLDGDQDIAYNEITVQSGGGGSSTGTVKGYVKDLSENPVESATVELDDGQQYTELTDGDGYYIFDNNVPVGQYNTQCFKPDVFQETGPTIDVYEDQITWLNFTVDVGDGGSGGEPVNITIYGYVYQNNTPEIPVINANVTARNANDQSQIFGWNHTNNIGYYIIEFNTTNTNVEVEIIATHQNYSNSQPEQFPLDMVAQKGGAMEMWPIIMDRIWETTNLVVGYVKDVDGAAALQGVIVVAEGPRYFWNSTLTDENGYFEINTIDDEPGSPFEFRFLYDGYFINCTEGPIDPYHDLGTIYLERIPQPYTAWINGTLTSEGTPIPYTELVLVDPSHPHEAEMADLPRTNATGVFNISTYPGTFNLVTLAKVIGKRKDGPPLAIGGYQNNMYNVTVAEYESYNFDDEIGGIDLNSANPDPINISMTMSTWNETTVAMSRRIDGNAKIVRTLMDTDKSGNLSFDELNTTINAVNNSLYQSNMFDDLLFYLNIPSGFMVDSTEYTVNASTVEFQGLPINSSIYSFTPFTIWINETLTPTSSINYTADLHSATLTSYYRNPAFEHNITIDYPTGYTVRNIRPELIRFWGLNTESIIVRPNYDPDINDTTFYEQVRMAIGSTNPFASLNETYESESTQDFDGNGKIDELKRKVKFTINQTGTYRVVGTLRSSTGITIDTFETENEYSNTGDKTVTLKFDGETIYMKNINGPYTIVFDLFYLGEAILWFDSINQTTAAYNYSDFQQPPIFFTGTVTDFGSDTDGNIKYDYFVVCLQVDVGKKGHYTFEGDIGTMDFNFEGDPHITHISKGKDFVTTGLQHYNLTFDGSLIYSKGRNASIWCNIRVRKDFGNLDEINHMSSEKYYYTEFDLPPPQNSSVYGNVTDVYGNPLEAQVRLEDSTTHRCTSNTTNSSTGAYTLNCTEGYFYFDANAFNPDLDNHYEFLILEEEEDALRNIRLLPPWHLCPYWINWDLDRWQYATGQNIYLNISCPDLSNSPTYIEVYREYREGNTRGEIYVTNQTNRTDEFGDAKFVINTTGFTNGDYIIKMVVYNQTRQEVARENIQGIQISSLQLDFEIDKDRYRSGSTGTGTYELKYISNSSYVQNATITWEIWYWNDYTHRDVTVSSDTFTSESGHGTFTFSAPDGQQRWYKIRLSADNGENRVNSERKFDIATGSVIESAEESPVGEEGNYDYLLLNVTVNVTSDGTYRVESCVNKDNWDHITYNETETFLSAGEHVVQIYFDGEQIQGQGGGYSGQFRIWMCLKRDSMHLDDYDYLTDDSYNTNDFSRPKAFFETDEGITYQALGTEGDYEALLVNCSINASTPGDYTVHANLHRKEQYNDGMEWHFVAWNMSETINVTEGGVYDTNTTINVTIRFEGADIYNSNQMGPWNVNFNLHERFNDGREKWITWYDPEEYTIPYNYSDFTKPAATLENITDHGSGTGDLIIGVQVNVSSGQSGEYRITGDLNSQNWWWITWDENETTLLEGVNEVNLSFSGESIYSAGYDGPYQLHVRIERVDPFEWLGGREFQTGPHSYTDFNPPGGIFTGTHSDEGYDEDSDGDNDYVRVNVTVNFSQTNNYEISGDLYKEVGYREWITWGNTQVQVTETGEQTVTLDFNGHEIMKSGYEGYYGISLWLRSETGDELDRIEFDTDTYYYLDEFSQPAVRFTDDSPTGDELSPSGDAINVTLKINSSEMGTYKVHGNLHKVVQHPEWDEWIWLTQSEKEVRFTEPGEITIVVSFDTAMIASSGYDGPYTIHFDLMDSNWNTIDFINDYQTQPYTLTEFADIPISFTGECTDELSSDNEWVIVNVTVNVNESGNYRISGDLHKQDGWMWNFIAGAGYEGQFSTGEHEIQLYFDSVEIAANIDDNNLNEFDSGTTFDIDLWVKRVGEGNDIDTLSTTSINTYSTSDFSQLGASIQTVSDNGYNQSGTALYEFLNITTTINFTEAATYELWCDLSKEDGFNWYWIGWKNTFITVSSSDVADGYEIVETTLQFKGERISSSDHDSPYHLYMELKNLDTGKRIDRYNGDTSGTYNATDFVGSDAEFDDDSKHAESLDTDDEDTNYNYLKVTVEVTANEDKNVVVFGDLHKQSGWQYSWIDWTENWTSISSGATNNITLLFDGEIIRNKEIDGPYQLRLELWDADDWSLLDVIDSFDTPAYSYENFQAPAAAFVDDNITDWGNDTDDDGFYDYLEVNVSVNVGTNGTYEISGDLHQDLNGWTWLGWTNQEEDLVAGESTVKLLFSGSQIRNKGVNGPYKIRLELRDSNRRTMDHIESYSTQTYSYTDFQGSGAELIGSRDRGVGTQGSYDYLELNVTVNCTSAGTEYWIGADLHKQSGYEWTFIAWESEEFTSSVGEQVIPIYFSGEQIRNSEVDGPYQVRIDLRDRDTWSEQDLIERNNTQDYNYTDFKQPSASFYEGNITDWGNDTDSDTEYNYLDVNVSINCTTAGTYWIHADLHKQTGYSWEFIDWKGKEITLDDSGEQIVKLQFDGEIISSSDINGPYHIRLELTNPSDWRRYDVIERYTTNTYTATQFEQSTISFVENDYSPSDRGIGTLGAYSYLDVNVSIDSSSTGTYWLHADLFKDSAGRWEFISWKGQEITHNGTGIENFTVLFDGSQIRNKQIDGPYKVHFELMSVSGEWKRYDFIEQYTTNSYSYTDFASAGVQLVDQSAGTADYIAAGNLQINVTLNSSTSGDYKIWGDLHKESAQNWQWITWNETQVSTNDSGEQTFPLTFEGGDIYEKGIDGPYHVRIELRSVGTGSTVDSIDRYTTGAYSYTNFSTPPAGMNRSETTDSAPNYEYLQINITAFSTSSKEYQVNGVLFGDNWEFIDWLENVSTISGYDNVRYLQFDGSIINSTGVDPARCYIEMRRTSDWKLIDNFDYELQGTYNASDFGASVSINTSNISSDVWDSDGDGYNNSLNITFNVTFSSAGEYELFGGLKDQSGTKITGAKIDETSYDARTYELTLAFDGLTIYNKGLNGPYDVSFIAVSKQGTGEVARVTDVHTTEAYSYDRFEHAVAGSEEEATLMGNYSSFASNTTGDSLYEYLIVNVSINVTSAGTFDVYGDLYSSDGTTWITADEETETLSVGEHAVQLHFEGNDIYDSYTNGPYLLGYVRIGADIDGTWLILDEASNVHTTASYNYTDFEPNGSAIQELTPSSVSSVTVSNDPFSPNSDGIKDTTIITVTATAGQTLYANIYNSTNAIKRTGMPLSGSGTTYTTTWIGKDDSNTVVSDGTYRVKVSDEATGNAENEAEETTTVVVDTAAPTGSTISINNDDQYTNTTSVTLTLSSTDNSSKKMRFKNAGGNWTDWEDFQSSRAWNLTSTDGSKTVSFQVNDTAGNLATMVNDSITLDSTKPSSVNITITGKGDTPSTHSNDVSVTLSIAAEDATSGVEYMMIANTVAFSERSWEEYNESKEWTLTSGYGIKTVYIKVKDRAGKVSNIYSDNIILDTTDPGNLTISINSGQQYTNTTNVTLTVSATDNNNVAKMSFSNDSTNWSAWETYATEKNNWPLTSGDGTKRVYFRCKDSAGNIADHVNDTITLDTNAPTLSNVNHSSISQSSATITWTTNEASTTYVEYGTTTSYGTNTTLNTTKVTSHSQTLTGLTAGTTYHYRVKSKDTAGNQRTGTDKTFTTTSGVDTTAPNPIENLTAVDKPNAEQNVTLTWNQSTAQDFGGYKIYRDTDSFDNVTNIPRLDTITSISTTTYTDDTAVDDEQYYYAVTVIDTATPPNENKNVNATQGNYATGTSWDDKPPSTTDDIPIGWQTSAPTFTLTATDSGKNVNFTIYTTDGSDATNESNPDRIRVQATAEPSYVSVDNITDDGIYSIVYYSYDKNSTQNNESTHTKTLKIDSLPPITSDNAPSSWQNTTVTVVLTSTDDSSATDTVNISGVSAIYYTKDGSDPTLASSQYDASTPILFTTNGNRTLKYRARDNATNLETIRTAYVLIDTVRPTSSVSQPSSAYSSSPFTVSWSSSDATSGIHNVTIQVKNGTGSWIDWLTNQNASGSASYEDGSAGYTYYFRSIARDNASNIENDYTSNGDTSTTVSTDRPTATISSPSNNSYCRQNQTFTGTANDSSLDLTRWWLNHSADGSTWTNIENSTSMVNDSTLGTLNTSTLSDGAYTIQLYVKNQAAMENWANITINIDNTQSNLTDIASSVTSNSATITWTTNENANSTVLYSTIASNLSSSSESTTLTTSHSITLTGLSASTKYYYKVRSYDRAGNQNTSTTTYNFTTSETPTDDDSSGGYTPPQDTGSSDSAPSISDIYHEPTTITSNNYVNIYATVTDDYQLETVELHWNEGTAHSKSMILRNDNIYNAEIGPFPDGTTVTYRIKATDNASQTTDSDENSFTVEDQTPPVITINSPYHGTATDDRTPTIQASYSDPAGIDTTSISLVVDGSDKTSYATITDTQITYIPTIPMEYDADHTVILTVDDLKGNSATKTWTFTIRELITSATQKIDTINKGESKTVSFTDTDTNIDEIEINAAEDLSDVEVHVTRFDEKPEEVDEPADKYVHSYLDIHTNAQDDDIASLTIKFKISQGWLEDNDIEKEDVILMRYKNDEWQELLTTNVHNDVIYAYFEAEADGTSIFAISASVATEKDAQPFDITYALIAAVLTVIIIAGLVYYRRRTSL